jgi:hypothetical protein
MRDCFHRNNDTYINIYLAEIAPNLQKKNYNMYNTFYILR